MRAVDEVRHGPHCNIIVIIIIIIIIIITCPDAHIVTPVRLRVQGLTSGLVEAAMRALQSFYLLELISRDTLHISQLPPLRPLQCNG